MTARRVSNGRLVIIALTVVAVVVAVVVVVLRSRGEGPLPRSANVTVTQSRGGTVRVTGATLSVPPGAVSGNGQLAASVNDTLGGGKLSADGKAGGGKPVIALAGRAVSLELRGATLVHPATLTLSVDRSALAGAGDISKRNTAAWLAFFDEKSGRWVPVPSSYDPDAGKVTAQVSHLSIWSPFTLDWQAITLRLRQALSVLGTVRAPKTDCKQVEGMGAKMENPSDPPLIGCVTGDAASGYFVSITNNRGYSMLLTPPKGAIQQKREFAGFEEYVQSRDLVAKAIGGPYLGPLKTVSYRLPAAGGPYTFTGSISVKTTTVDLATAVSLTLFDAVTLGYATCILDNVAHSGAATLDEAPKLVGECFPGVGLVFSIAEDLKYLASTVWAQEDKVFDTALKIHPRVDVTPEPPVIPEGLEAAPVSATSVRLNWADKSSTESGYRVYLNDKALPSTRPASSTSTVVTELKPETKYCFAVEAVGTAGGSGKSNAACATTPSLPVPDLSTWTGFELGKLYKQPHFPSMIGIDNHNYLSELVWNEIGKSQAVATGSLLIDDCTPNCAEGTYVTHRAEVVASQPMTCNVPVAVTYSDKSKYVEAYVYSVITVRDLENNPDPHYVGNDVILTGCSASVPRKAQGKAVALVQVEGGDDAPGEYAEDERHQKAPAYGWSELFAEKYSHAGGLGHTALFIENVQGFEVEIVAD